MKTAQNQTGQELRLVKTKPLFSFRLHNFLAIFSGRCGLQNLLATFLFELLNVLQPAVKANCALQRRGKENRTGTQNIIIFMHKFTHRAGASSLLESFVCARLFGYK